MVLDAASHLVVNRLGSSNIVRAVVPLVSAYALSSWSAGYVCTEERNIHNKTYILVVRVPLSQQRCRRDALRLTAKELRLTFLATGSFLWPRAGAVPCIGCTRSSSHRPPSQSRQSRRPSAAAAPSVFHLERKAVRRRVRCTQRCQLKGFRCALGEGRQKWHGAGFGSAHRRARLL